MCGLIIGEYHYNTDDYKKALNAMSHRGLSNHYEREEKFFLGHNTLPIASLNEWASRQPKYHRPFLFTGEVFNYRNYGDFENDTETLHHFFEVLPFVDFLHLAHTFNGFWAIAGIKNDKLVAMTDYLNQKPLYYRNDMNVVASEPYSLSLLKKTTEDKVFFSNIQKWGYDMTGRTPWHEIKMIPPGHIYVDGTVYPYWNWDKVELVDDLRTLLYEETKLRLKGQRKIALLLSGGLDSSIVYSIVKEKADCFHVENNETEYAIAMNEEVKCIDLSEATVEESLIAHQSPVDLGSVVPQMALAKTLKDLGYHVCLSGDGADELFGGYRRSRDYDSQQSDVFCELPYYHHPRLDRIMMSQTIELRSPFLSAKVVKFALQLPHHSRIDKNYLKSCFPDLPEKILSRKKKPLKTQSIQGDLLSNTKNNIKLFKEHFYD